MNEEKHTPIANKKRVERMKKKQLKNPVHWLVEDVGFVVVAVIHVSFDYPERKKNRRGKSG